MFNGPHVCRVRSLRCTRVCTHVRMHTHHTHTQKVWQLVSSRSRSSENVTHPHARCVGIMTV
jgi:hypothetical protein